MNRVVQALLYVAFAVFIGYLSIAPAYHYADPELAEIKLSLSHAADRVEKCVKLTPQEINERARRGEPINECGRERLPLVVELDIDGAAALSVVAVPSGLWNDGPSSVYERLSVEAGPHTITVRLKDSARESGWDYEETATLDLAAGRYLTITFRADNGGFEFR